MKRALVRLSMLSTSGMLGASLLFAQAPAVSPSPAPTAQPPAMSESQNREMQALLARVGELGNLILKNPQATDAWRHQVAQGEVMLQLAVRCQGKEREDWLRVAVDSYFSAAVGAPENDLQAMAHMQQLPARISQAFPGSPAVSHAALQEIQADYMRLLAKSSENPSKAQQHLRDRLLQFAVANATLTGAPNAIIQAGQLSETLGKKDDARRCYQYVVENYASQPIARKAAGMVWRLGPVGEPVNLKLPQLFAASARGVQPFELKEARGKVVVVYFWASTSESAEGDFVILKSLTDRYRSRGMEVVYVNLDGDTSKAREFLGGRLTSGVHLDGKGGLDSAVAEMHGIQSLPYLFVVDRDGTLAKHGVEMSSLHSIMAQYFPDSRRR